MNIDKVVQMEIKALMKGKTVIPLITDDQEHYMLQYTYVMKLIVDLYSERSKIYKTLRQKKKK